MQTVFFFKNIDAYFPLRGIHMRLPRIAVQNRKLILSWICRTCHRKLCFLYFSIMKSHLNNHLPFSFWLGVDREAQENYKDSLDDMKLYTTLLCNSRLLLKKETWSCFQIYLPRLPNSRIKIEQYQLFVWETNQLFKPAPPWSAILLLRWTNYRKTSRSFVNLICTAGLHPRPLQGKAGEREEKYRSLTVGGKDICAKYHLRLRRLSMKSESAFLLQCMHAEN